MKAITSGENSGAAGVYSAGGVYGSSTKVVKHKRDVENEEIRAYLSKLKELVPFMPKNRRLSKLEVIQYAIDYICDLQHALETHPTISSVAVHSAAAAAVVLSSASQAGRVNLQMLGDATAPLHRQPLGILPPNANAKTLHIRSTCSASASTSATGSALVSATTLETSSISASGRPNEMITYPSDSSKHVAC
ncbi:DNA-binding protein inhibitor ID-2 [Sarracenia purpurea var. burkii]